MWDCDSTKIQRAFLRGTLAAFLVLNITLRLLAEDVTVRDANEFRRVAGKADPGTRILLAPGYYAGGFHFPTLRGTMDRPIVIGAADTNRVPVIESIHLSSPMFVEFHHLIIAGWSGNGLNIDDGGTFETPAEHITL